MATSASDSQAGVQAEKYRKFVSEQIAKYSLTCYLSFTADCHLNEYIGDEDQRVFFLTNFTGSNGIAISGHKECLITDSRYFGLANKESVYPLYKGKLTDYIRDNELYRISFNRKYISHTRYQQIIEILEKDKRYSFILTDEDEQVTRKTTSIELLERVRIEEFQTFKPKIEPKLPINEYLESFGLGTPCGSVTGENYKQKLTKITEILNNSDRNALIIAEPDTICWILNIRSKDIKYNPLLYAYLIITRDSTTIFTDHNLNMDGIKVKQYNEFNNEIKILKNESVLISGEVNEWIYSQLSNVEFTNEIRELQAIKNKTELLGMVLAYFYEGIALTELFGYLERTSEELSEMDVVRKLEEIRMELPGYVEPSFSTISASGKNAAVPHHQSSEDRINRNEVFLIDAGSHFKFGTTDTTRVLLMNKEETKNENGISTGDLVHDATLVLKGQLAAMMGKYGLDETYRVIDLRARQFLMNEEKDFGHATGHGVGHYLPVHESPPVVAPGSKGRIKNGHVFSIEPGYYRDEKYGIRIENLVYAVRTGLETRLINITMVPYQRRMIDTGMLREDEKAYLNEFNEKCRALLAGYLSKDGYDYLMANTAHID